MKRLAATAFITLYVTALSWGIVAHAVKLGVNSHPAMYFVVWDMFCGWSAYAERTQVIAEGESGRYYQVAPAPWGELNPFGHIDRRHYDPSGDLMPRLIRNNLKHTSHEPITAVYIVEEVWPKKYNMPDHIWAERFLEPKDLQKYFNIKRVYNADGVLMQCNQSWHGLQLARSISNPRLHRQAAGSQPFFTVSPGSSGNPQRSMAPSAN